MAAAAPARALPRPPRLRAGIGLLLALLVQLGGWLLLQQQHRPASAKLGPALMELRLLAERQPPPRSEAVATPVPAPRRAAAPRQDEDAAPVLPVSSLPVALPQVPSEGANSSRPIAAPLNLALPPARPASGPRPPASMLSQMLNDPRSHSVKTSVESAIADAAGTLPVTVQDATDGTNSRLVRQGSKCTRVTEARIKTLNPMDDASRGAPSVSGACVN